MKELTDEQIKFIKDSESSWMCPKTHIFKPSESTWCGKNLYCQHCNEYHYYKEYEVLTKGKD